MKKIFLISMITVLSLTSLAGCNNSQKNDAVAKEDNTQTQQREFEGTKGDFLEISNGEILISADEISDGKAHFYNTKLPNGSPVYFFVVKSPDGKLRAAANGCQVCGPALQGFHQEGDFMVCNTCGNQYPLNKIATEKGGCNPAPINPDLKIQDGNISITLEDLQNIQQYFN